MNLENIFANNKEWVEKKLKIDRNYFHKLSQGQNPDILYIGCSDSRVSAEELMGVGPGDVFVHRNIANMVPNTDLGTMSTIHYAVDYLKVNHIIVCGHYNCGGVEAAMQSEDLGILNPWLRNIRDVYRLHQKELESITSEKNRYNRLVELNVQEQCINLIKTPEVQKAYKSRDIEVHGWIFDIFSGKLRDLDINLDQLLKEIMEIYNIE